MTATVSNGRGIFMLMYAAEMDAYEAGEPTTYPTPTSAWTSSTAYFNACKSTVFSDVSAAFFAAPEIPPAREWPMKSENNAWALNASFTNAAEAPSDVPFLFTRNLRFRPRPTGGVEAYLVDAPPFGSKGCVIVTFGGATKRLFPRDLHLAVDEAKPEFVQHVLQPEGTER
ncbi:MAG: hypothetical protein O2854_08835 [Chloroflexi bacterium]|nr:hypothetical protein [Chloroflexota bacterium]